MKLRCQIENFDDSPLLLVISNTYKQFSLTSAKKISSGTILKSNLQIPDPLGPCFASSPNMEIQQRTTVFVFALYPLPAVTSRYLWGRDFQLVETANLDEARKLVKQNPLSPIFVSVQWLKNNNLATFDPHPLTAPLITYYSETDSYQAYGELKTLPTQECFFSPLTGTAIERIIRGHQWTADDLKPDKATPGHCLNILRAKLNQKFDHRQPIPAMQLPLSEKVAVFCYITATGPQSYLIATSHQSQKGEQELEEIFELLESSLKATSGEKFPFSRFQHQLLPGWVEHFMMRTSQQCLEDYDKGHRWLIAFRSEQDLRVQPIPELKNWEFLVVQAEDLPVGLVFGTSVFVQFAHKDQPTMLISPNEGLSSTKKMLLAKHGLERVLIASSQWQVFLQSLLGYHWSQQLASTTMQQKLA